MAALPQLIFGYGNPSRGDDALGPALIQRLAKLQARGPLAQRSLLRAVDLLTDFQLQPEHALDLVGRDRVILVDADASLEEPYRLEPVTPDLNASYTTHSMAPGALLWVYGKTCPGPPPPCALLRIRGYHFALGEPLTAEATANLELAQTFLLASLAND